MIKAHAGRVSAEQLAHHLGVVKSYIYERRGYTPQPPWNSEMIGLGICRAPRTAVSDNEPL